MTAISAGELADLSAFHRRWPTDAARDTDPQQTILVSCEAGGVRVRGRGVDEVEVVGLLVPGADVGDVEAVVAFGEVRMKSTR